MPRDGSNIYHRPVGTDGVPNYPIESTKYNANVADVEQDLNLPRPIVAGGTGATNAADARFNIAAETATQIVTSYDTQVWMPGSFQSAVGATGAPNSTSVFAGVCYLGEALANPPTNQNVVIEARDISSPIKPGPIYTRQKTAGVWSAWNSSGGGTDDASNRAAIYAAPFDALAYNGMQINGSMEVSQQYGLGNIVNANGAYPVDGFLLSTGGTQVLAAGQVAVAPAGFKNAIILYASTANSSPAAGHYASVLHPIEGYRFLRAAFGTAAATSVTVGFWVNCTTTGLFAGSLQNGAQSRSYVFTYTINAANTWEYKTVTIPGDTSGTWATDNAAGAYLGFSLLSGATYKTATPATWLAGNFLATTTSTNLLKNTTDSLVITGVTVLPGIEAPSAARSPLIMRPYDQELVTCKRYYFKSYADYTKPGTVIGVGSNSIFLSGSASAANLFDSLIYPATMRSVPAITTYDNAGTSGKASYFTTAWNNNGTISVLNASNNSVGFYAPSSGVATAYNFDFVADARL